MLLRDIVKKCGRRYGNKIALIDEQGSLTFSEVNIRANQIASALSQRGVRKGDRVAALLYNINDYTAIYFACAKAGYVLVPINYRLMPKEILFILQDGAPTAFIFDSEFIDTIQGLRGDLDSIHHFMVADHDTPPAPFENFDQAIGQQPDHEPDTDIDPDDLAFLMYTSGTTGPPKGAMISQKNVVAGIINQFSDVCPDEEDILINFPPLYHMGGLLTLFVHYYRGCTTITVKQFETRKALEWIENKKPTAAHLVPAMQNLIMHHPDVKNYDLSSLRTIFYGASAMLVSQLKQSMALFDCRYFQFAGLTEVTGSLSTLKPKDHVTQGSDEQIKRLGSAGRAVMGFEVKIVDLKGNECPSGVKGEEVARGDAVMAGYWNLPAETQQTIRDGWLHTGDICMKDEAGYIYYMDRTKDMINRGGENVYPREIEEVIVTHPRVREVAVIGIPDKIMGEEVKAIIVPMDGQTIDEDEIINLCRKNLAAYKKPRSIEFVAELPKNPTGKILKTVLRESYQ